jgi:hypothetical protein
MVKISGLQSGSQQICQVMIVSRRQAKGEPGKEVEVWLVPELCKLTTLNQKVRENHRLLMCDNV